MNQFATLQSSLQTRVKSRSMGLKLIVVSLLALLMTIPSFFVLAIVSDRTDRASQVAREISAYVGGQQTFLGPTLAIPYSIPATPPSQTVERGVYLVFPSQASATVKTSTQERRRSLFKVPVFQSELNFDSIFDLTGVPTSAPQGAILDWSHAEFIVGATDARGALSDGTLLINGESHIFVPAASSEYFSVGSDSNRLGPALNLALFGVQANELAHPDAKFHLTANLRFSGAQRIAVLAYGKTTTLSITGDWPSPSFDGGFLPVNRTITPQGFTAQWSVPFIARGVRDQGRASSLNGLESTALGVTFAEVADPYQSVNRSVKYSLLFIGLLFLSYFVFEVTCGKRVHPAQYVLVGVAHTIFYLLLLSLAERLGFDYGFLIGGAATVLLLSANAAWIFKSRMQGLRAFFSFTLLYSFIYLLLRLEDNALLLGAVASFLAVAAVMYFTRKIDWYSSMPAMTDAEPPPPVLPK